MRLGCAGYTSRFTGGRLGEPDGDGLDGHDRTRRQRGDSETAISPREGQRLRFAAGEVEDGIQFGFHSGIHIPIYWRALG